MPCGGIRPIAVVHTGEEHSSSNCFYCGKDDADHAVDEWDAVLHGRCVEGFLQHDEGQVIHDHKHSVVVRLDGATSVWYQEGEERERT